MKTKKKTLKVTWQGKLMTVSMLTETFVETETLMGTRTRTRTTHCKEMKALKVLMMTKLTLSEADKSQETPLKLN